MAALVVFGTVLPFSLYLYGVECIGAVKASMLASSEPVTAVLLSALWLDTEFLPPDIIGIVFILLTVGLLSKDKSNKKPVVVRKEGLINDRRVL
jgi:drug/metabolite transporter (DMT)-like permease